MSEPMWVPLGGGPGPQGPPGSSGAGIGTVLPVSPVNDQEYILVDSLTAPTYQWLFRYLAAKASNRWLFIGGAGLRSEVATAEVTSSGTYVALATPGPSVTLPLAGIYDLAFGCHTSNKTGFMSFDFGVTGAVDLDSIENAWFGSFDGGGGGLSRIIRKTLAANQLAVIAKYRGQAGCQWKQRWLSVTPVAVGG